MTARAQRPARLPRGPIARLVDVHSVPDVGLDILIEATPDQRAAVASATDLPGLEELSARLLLVPRAGGRFEMTGELHAAIIERCVVTLELFDSRIEQTVEVMFAPVAEPPIEAKGREPRSRDRRRDGREQIAPAVPGSDDQVDPPDPIVDDIIDVGAVVVEFLTLARDPYPRKPDAQFEEVVVGEQGEPHESAFAALGRLKERS